MTISGLLFAIYGWYNVWISHNLFYSLDLGIIIGFAISIVTKYFCNKTNKSNRSDNGQNYKKFLNLKLFSELLFYIDECKLKIDNDLDRKLYNIIDYSSNNKLNN